MKDALHGCRRSDVRLRLSLVADRLENAAWAHSVQSWKASSSSNSRQRLKHLDGDGIQPVMTQALSQWSDGHKSDTGLGLFSLNIGSLICKCQWRSVS